MKRLEDGGEDFSNDSLEERERERERESLEARRPWLGWGGPRDSDNDKPGRNRTVISASGRPSLLVFHGIR